MAFFWPIRKTGECAETKEDPYDENVPQKPKKPRKESTSSDDSEAPVTMNKTKLFGYLAGSSSESSSSESEEEEEVRKVEEIPAESVNDEEDEYEVECFFDYLYRWTLM